MSEKNVLIRQRLIELEKKHAKALKKLQRAEKYKQRRQTFHGFTVRDANTSNSITLDNSNLLLSKDTISTDVRNSRCSSAQKKGVTKTVTFKEALDSDSKGQPRSENECKIVEQSGSNKTFNRKSALLASSIPQQISEDNEKVLQCSVSSDNSFVAVDSSMVTPTGSLISSDNETILDSDVASTDGKDCFQSQQGVDLKAIDSRLCGSGQGVVQVPSTGNQSCNHELSQKQCHSNGLLGQHNAKNVLAQSKENVKMRNSSDHHNARDDSTRHTCSLEKANDRVTVIENGGKHQNESTSNSFTLDKSDYCPSGNQPWLWLFEEQFPRRSPRIQSMPNFRDQAHFSQDNKVTHAKKTKRIRKKKSRTENDTPISRNNNLQSTTVHENNGNSPHSSFPEESSCISNFVFPRPTQEQTKNGGSLAVVVDFSLPDREFAKLKLAKIKGTLSAERSSKDLNTVVEKITEEYGTEVMRDTKLFDTKCENKRVVEEKTAAENIGELEDHAASGLEEMKGQTERTEKQNFRLEGGVISSATGSKCLTQQEKKKNPTQLVYNEQKCKESRIVSSGDAWWSNSFESDHEQVVSHMHSVTAKQSQVSSEKESQKYKGVGICANHCNSCHINGSCTSFTDVVQQTDDNEKLNESYNNFCDGNSSWVKSNILDNLGDGLSEGKTPLAKSTVEINEEDNFSSQKHSNELNLKESVVLSDCGNAVSGEATVKEMTTIPIKQQHVQEAVSLTEVKSSPPQYYNEPSLGDAATPHGKMKEPLESSQLSQLMSPEESKDFSPLLMTACLQHYTQGMSNRVQSISLSSYEPSTARDPTVQSKDKRDILAVCLSHMVVIWTFVSESQWTVLSKWTLPVDGEEEFVSVKFVPIKSHVVLLVGGNFHHGNGRVLGYSEEGEYSLELETDEQENKYSFSTMSLLHDTKDYKTGEDVEFVIGDKTSNKITLTKWTLDSFCLLVEQWQKFTPIYSDSELSSLQFVHGSHCLLLGTTNENLILWNHVTCQQLRSINLHTSGLGQLSCINAFTDKGLLFLIMSSIQAAKGCNSDHKNSHGCSLYAMNPRNSRGICLESFVLPERVSVVSTNGQFIAAGDQEKNVVKLWNITSSNQYATLQVFQDEVSSIGFHQDKPLMAFGSITGCVHLFS